MKLTSLRLCISTLQVAAMMLPVPCIAQADAVQLAFPLDCRIGSTCIVQNYVDHDPGAGARDYACGLLTYDGHTGTDIRLPDTSPMRRGVAVLAAAPGRVRALRDNMDDVNVLAIGKAAIGGREAGNSIIVDLGSGWEVQYAHLRKGSIAVKVGDRVTQGQKIGLVGLSGNTSFPHLHFEVRFEGKPVDPFVGLGSPEQCGPGMRPLWAPATLAALAYSPTGVLATGFAGAPPKLEDGGVDTDAVVPLNAEAPEFVFWIELYGVRAEDIEELRITAPDGRVLAERRVSITENRGVRLLSASKRRSGPRWPAGNYRAEYALYRGPQAAKVAGTIVEYKLEASTPDGAR